MEHRKIGDVEVSLLGMGNMRLPQKGRVIKHIDKKAAQAIIDYAMDHGVTYYDTAYFYHGRESEPFLGEALRYYDRSTYKLATKYFMAPGFSYQKEFEDQLRNLRTDYIDFYLIHSIMDATYKRYLSNGCIEYFLEQQQKGRIGKLGFSSHCSTSNLITFADHHQWDFVQLQINFYDWIIGSAKAQYEAMAARNLPIIVMEPLRGGKLMEGKEAGMRLLRTAHPDWNMADWAFRWLKRLPQVSCILSGMNSIEQITQNVRIFSGEPGTGEALTDEEATLLLSVADMDKGFDTVPCTGCGYCIESEGCPSDIDIPYWLDLYNLKMRGQKVKPEDHQGGTPADCIGCGACASRCPQTIDIPAIMDVMRSW